MTQNVANNNDKQVLRARAKSLARRADRAAPVGAMFELLEFRLAQERYALETRWVREVLVFQELTPLPCCPNFVLGIVNVRGRILPVFDLKRFFDLPEKGITDLHRIVLVGGNDLELGILVDTVVGVRSMAAPDLQSSSPAPVGVPAGYLKGVTSDRLIVVDMARILADPKIIVHEEIET